MAEKECPKCEGRGKYYDRRRHLVQVKCDRCGGSGRVPTDEAGSAATLQSERADHQRGEP